MAEPFFDKTKHTGWLVKYDYKNGYKIINKQCDVSTGAQDIPFKDKRHEL